MKLYFKNGDQATTLVELLTILYAPLLPKMYGYASPTYFDRELTKLECNAHRRSFEDLLVIAKTYFPKTTKTQLMWALKRINIKFYHCNGIKK